MERTKTPREWYDYHIQEDWLYRRIMKSLGEAIDNGSIDIYGEMYVGLVQDIVSSGVGQYTPFYALDYFDYDIDLENTEQYDIQEALIELETFTNELEDIINDKITLLGVVVQFGYWESDGTYCMMAHYSVEEYGKSKLEMEAYLNGEKTFDWLE